MTEKLKVGSGICLVSIHDPISLAKTVATLDRSTGGRVIHGIGAGGWNRDEVEDHGIRFDRWNVVRERVLAMREIWSNEVAAFSGDFVKFEPLKAWPKPVQQGGPKVLLGATSRWSANRPRLLRRLVPG